MPGDSRATKTTGLIAAGSEKPCRNLAVNVNAVKVHHGYHGNLHWPPARSRSGDAAGAGRLRGRGAGRTTALVKHQEGATGTVHGLISSGGGFVSPLMWVRFSFRHGC